MGVLVSGAIDGCETGFNYRRILSLINRLVVPIIVILVTSTVLISTAGATGITVTFSENDNVNDIVGTYQVMSSPSDLTLFSNLSPQFSNPGYVFNDWNTKADGSGVSYSNGELCSSATDLYLYAQWIENS
ncbi:MAG: InlB B-repeat-containing protein, partial [Acidimicrobiales bacterium]